MTFRDTAFWSRDIAPVGHLGPMTDEEWTVLQRFHKEFVAGGVFEDAALLDAIWRERADPAPGYFLVSGDYDPRPVEQARFGMLPEPWASNSMLGLGTTIFEKSSPDLPYYDIVGFANIAEIGRKFEQA